MNFYENFPSHHAVYPDWAEYCFREALFWVTVDVWEKAKTNNEIDPKWGWKEFCLLAEITEKSAWDERITERALGRAFDEK